MPQQEKHLLTRIPSLPSSLHSIFLLSFGRFFLCLPHFNNDLCDTAMLFSPCTYHTEYLGSLEGWGWLKSTAEHFLTMIKRTLSLRWLLVACFCPKSQLGLIKLTLLGHKKLSLYHLLSPDSAFMSYGGDKIVEAEMQETVEKIHLWYPLPKVMTCSHNVLHVLRHHAQLSRATFCLQCTT